MPKKITNNEIPNLAIRKNASEINDFVEFYTAQDYLRSIGLAKEAANMGSPSLLGRKAKQYCVDHNIPYYEFEMKNVKGAYFLRKYPGEVLDRLAGSFILKEIAGCEKDIQEFTETIEKLKIRQQTLAMMYEMEYTDSEKDGLELPYIKGLKIVK